MKKQCSVGCDGQEKKNTKKKTKTTEKLAPASHKQGCGRQKEQPLD